eukprot:CAMPEP_0174834776 /NCGR_PEP_ID=MMETSP1114-20130205/5038_1 /TAXON_ID=312471 /ORGANISM="Neobodo designis, Strain CCAP 1951/1" /LENGTH=558 /DNA_ID=CAMNT_0016068705 /DNA_START=77 /DNA_END=1753 /DNA_ORIENTATION=+
MRRATTAAVTLLVLAAVAATVASAEEQPVYVPIQQLGSVGTVEGRRKVLDDFASWLRINGMPVAGPSAEDEANLAVVCSDGPDGEEDCRTPIAALNADASESATLFSVPRRLMFGEGAAITPELRQQMDGWATALNEAAKNGDSESRRTLRSLQHHHGLPVILSLLYETYVVGNASGWAPWIATLPTEKEIKEQSALFVTKEAADCLDISGRRLWRAMRRGVKSVQGLVKDFCLHVNRETIKQRPDAKGVDISKVQITEGSGCYFSPSKINWAFALVGARLHRVSNRFTASIMPFVDMLPYHPRPNVAPGVVHYAGPDGEIDPDVGMISPPTEKHQPATIDFIAGSALKAGDPLSFRTRFFEPIDALLQLGYHRAEHFESGMPALIAWDTAAAEALDARNCSTDPNANRIHPDGTFDDAMIACAELHVTRGSTDEETASLRAQLSIGQVSQVTIGAHDFLASHAKLALGEIASKETHPRCYDPKRGPVARAFAEHNTETRRIFALFAERVAERRAQKVEVQQAIDAAVERADEQEKQAKAAASSGDDEAPPAADNAEL